MDKADVLCPAITAFLRFFGSARFPRIIVFTFLAMFAAGSSLTAQELPQKIRGYKVYDEIIRITNQGSGPADKPTFVLGTPMVADVSLGGITLDVAGELKAAGYSGRVEMITFKDFRINGLRVEVQEYDTPFSISKKGTTALPSPATVFLPSKNVLNAAWKEITDSKENWIVTGRVFVFGRFKKFGFSFKRVVPVDVRLEVPNPLFEYRKRAFS